MEDLDSDVLDLVLHHLSVQDLLHVERVNRHLRTVAQRSTAWRVCYERQYDIIEVSSTSDSELSSWKQVYKAAYAEEKRRNVWKVKGQVFKLTSDIQVTCHARAPLRVQRLDALLLTRDVQAGVATKHTKSEWTAERHLKSTQEEAWRALCSSSSQVASRRDAGAEYALFRISSTDDTCVSRSKGQALKCWQPMAVRKFLEGAVTSQMQLEVTPLPSFTSPQQDGWSIFRDMISQASRVRHVVLKPMIGPTLAADGLVALFIVRLRTICCGILP